MLLDGASVAVQGIQGGSTPLFLRNISIIGGNDQTYAALCAETTRLFTLLVNRNTKTWKRGLKSHTAKKGRLPALTVVHRKGGVDGCCHLNQLQWWSQACGSTVVGILQLPACTFNLCVGDHCTRSPRQLLVN